MTDHWFAYGFKSREAAETALHNAIADGEVSPCEKPRVEAYAATSDDGKRYGIRVTI